jgi:thiamine-phosphate pyrophosphorylase
MRLVDFSFYLVTDRHQTLGRPLFDVCEAAFRAGVRAVQLREKDLPSRPLLSIARDLVSASSGYGAKVFLNDRIDVALAARCAGVQLPAAGFPAPVARKVWGPDRLIGVSIHSAAEAARAEGAGADFVVLGPIFDTPSKRPFGPPVGLAELERARKHCRIPLFAIGGITHERVRDVRRAGAFGIAVVGSVMGAQDVERSCLDFLAALNG